MTLIFCQFFSFFKIYRLKLNTTAEQKERKYQPGFHVNKESRCQYWLFLFEWKTIRKCTEKAEKENDQLHIKHTIALNFYDNLSYSILYVVLSYLSRGLYDIMA